ncbi:YceD family protein [Solimonas terrae]|uniref:Large ribosomal RNA subunit accumulation protein YceD n=1 Tax=Solimonas terrae TaxID=1396819 RepID=A0A6M2BWC8_9GAMM|nr:hypothetical protein [Solimonas terrae]
MASSALTQRQAYSGHVPLGSLERLREVLADDVGELQVELHAHKSPGRELLQGTIDGELVLSCQRCDARIAWPLHVDVDLRLVHTEEEEQAVLHETDPYRVQDDRLPLREIVEDEILLALPMLPRCESCENAVQASTTPKGDEDAVRREVNPFAALKERLGK